MNDSARLALPHIRGDPAREALGNRRRAAARRGRRRGRLRAASWAPHARFVAWRHFTRHPRCEDIAQETWLEVIACARLRGAFVVSVDLKHSHPSGANRRRERGDRSSRGAERLEWQRGAVGQALDRSARGPGSPGSSRIFQTRERSNRQGRWQLTPVQRQVFLC